MRENNIDNIIPFESEEESPSTPKSAHLAASFLPAISMILLICASFLPSQVSFVPPIAMYAIIEILVFAIPMVIMVIMRKKKDLPCKFRLKFFRPRLIPFVIFMSFAAALLAFFLNYFSAMVMGGALLQDTAYTEFSKFTAQNTYIVWLVIALIPALIEELFFRGAVLSSQESTGQATAIMVTAITFAVIHATPLNFLGLFITGLIFGYISIALDSIWPAIIAHLINNSIYLLLGSTLKRYAAFGIWPYFIMVTIAALFIFSYLAARSFEKELSRGKIQRLAGSSIIPSIIKAVLSPGVIMIVIILVIKVLFKL